jgi:hypothetical protein
MNGDRTCTATFGTPIGGIAVPVNKLGLFAPWLELAALASLAALMVARVRRRKGIWTWQVSKTCQVFSS